MPVHVLRGKLAESHAETHNEMLPRSPCCASQTPAAWFAHPTDRHKPRTNLLVLRHPTDNSAAQTSRERPSPVQSSASARTAAPCVRTPCSPVTLRRSFSKYGTQYAAASAGLSDPVPKAGQ